MTSQCGIVVGFTAMGVGSTLGEVHCYGGDGTDCLSNWQGCGVGWLALGSTANYTCWSPRCKKDAGGAHGYANADGDCVTGIENWGQGGVCDPSGEDDVTFTGFTITWPVVTDACNPPASAGPGYGGSLYQEGGLIGSNITPIGKVPPINSKACVIDGVESEACEGGYCTVWNFLYFNGRTHMMLEYIEGYNPPELDPRLNQATKNAITTVCGGEYTGNEISEGFIRQWRGDENWG
jgi:hypothetical protein